MNILDTQIKSFLNTYYPNENTVIFTGSISINEHSSNSDIDLLIFTSNYHYPFISKVNYESNDFHAKFVPLNKAIQMIMQERIADVPVLCDMILKGQGITDKFNLIKQLKELASETHLLGPYTMSFELEQRYLVDISRGLEVLDRNQSFETNLFIIGDVVATFSGYILLKNHKWPHTPKKRLEQLNKYLPKLSKGLTSSVIDAYQNRNTVELSNLVKVYLSKFGGGIHYYNSKLVDELTNYNKDYLGIQFAGCPNNETFFEAASKLMNSLAPDFLGFYFYSSEDIKEALPNYYLVLLQANAESIMRKMNGMRASLIQNGSTVNFIFPSNHAGFVHERQMLATKALSVYINVSSYIERLITKGNRINTFPVLIVKLLASFSGVFLTNEEYITFLEDQFEKWMAAAVDYSNTFNVMQITKRKVWLKETYEVEGAKIIKSDAYLKFLTISDDDTKQLSEIIASEFNNLTEVPNWFISEYTDTPLSNMDFLLNTILDAFLIQDKKRAYLFYLVGLYLKRAL